MCAARHRAWCIDSVWLLHLWKRWPAVPCSEGPHFVAPVPHVQHTSSPTTCNLQRETRNGQLTTGQHTTASSSMQHASCNPHATCNTLGSRVQHAPHSIWSVPRFATCRTPRCNERRATRSRLGCSPTPRSSTRTRCLRSARQLTGAVPRRCPGASGDRYVTSTAMCLAANAHRPIGRCGSRSGTSRGSCRSSGGFGSSAR